MPLGRRAEKVLLQAQEHLHAAGVALFFRLHRRPVGGQAVRRHAPVLPFQRGVAGKADGPKAGGKGGGGHLGGGVFAVAKGGVGVQVLGLHGVIFSCFTLWSMMWREASSL